MLKKSTVIVIACLWLPLDVWAGVAGFERGQQLFEQSGCTGCHTSAVQDELARKGLAYEQPMRSRIMTKLRTQAAIIQDRENRFGLSQTDACLPARAGFPEEYRRIHNTILHGNPVFPMPAWQQRSGADLSLLDGPAASGDIDEVIDYLLVSEGLGLTKDAIARWKSDPAACANAAVQVAAVNAGSATRRQQIYTRLEQLNKKQHVFDTLPTVTFRSYQTQLLNQVGYLEDGDLDIWTLRQAEGDDVNYNISRFLQDKRFPNPFLFVIAIDKSDLQYRAYFFKQPSVGTRFIFKQPKVFFIREMARNPNHFNDADTSDCFSCHSSGALHLRPRQWAGIPDLDADNWSMINRFNRRMLAYGAVSTDWPANQPAPDPHAMEAVTTAACQGCHNPSSIRAPLLRVHSKAIVSLMNAHEEKSGYYDYSLPKPDPILMILANKFQTEAPSVSRRILPAMPPLGPMTEQENADLFLWLGAPVWGVPR